MSVIVQITRRQNRDVVDALETALNAAREGQIIGIAGVLLFHGGGWDTLIRGYAAHDPLVALGATVSLKTELAQIANSSPPK